VSVAALDANDPREYVRLAMLVRGEIASGQLKPGKLVSITTLC